MNAYCIEWYPGDLLIEPAPVDPDLDGLPLSMAKEKCRRIIVGCIEAVKRATEPETPRLVLTR